MVNEVYINGLRHKVVECENTFETVCHQGMVDFNKCEIKINKDMCDEMKKLTLVHEMTHAMLVSIGRDDLSEDEVFVNSLSATINQSFNVKDFK